MSEIDCPRAKSPMTPCVLRDGDLAVADDGLCVGCGIRPYEELARLAQKMGRAVPPADALHGLVQDYLTQEGRHVPWGTRDPEGATVTTDHPASCPECGRVHVMGCWWCGADLDARDHYGSCQRAGQSSTQENQEGPDRE